MWESLALNGSYFFTLCKERRQYGELIRPEPSRFLHELPQDDLHWPQGKKIVTAEERMQKGQSHIADIKSRLGLGQKNKQ
ncbi:ATP-dependent DNA helicase Rep [Photorhabdus temperata subsp. temperata M1021]|nr:ATP-dependent DNA helicase Rep [Photorhabdus temperata subsp. temperata M1021]